jgi:hypothetical protein
MSEVSSATRDALPTTMVEPVIYDWTSVEILVVA